MSKSFALENGDLVVQNRSYRTVKGKDKLFQDLKTLILTPLGSDPATPTYGSTLEGSITDSEETPGVIGGYTTAALLVQIKTELTDIIEQYQTDQMAKIQEELIQYDGQTTLDPDEIIKSIDAIDVAQSADMILVRISLTTIGDSSVQITLPLQQG